MRRLNKGWVVTLAVMAVGWIGFAWLIVPWLIADAYAGESLEAINLLIVGQNQHSLEHYLHAWRRLAVILTAASVVGAAATYFMVRERRRLRTSRRSVARLLIHDGRPLSATGVLVVCVGVGLAAGYAELIILAVRHLGFGYLGWAYSATDFWMTPAATGLLFLAIGAVGAIAARSGLRVTLEVGILLTSALATFGLIRFTVPQLYEWAALLLAVGVASRCAMAIRTRPDGTQRVLRRAALSLGVLSVVLAAGVQGLVAAREARARAHLPAASGATNVVLLLLDTVRSLSMSLYGYERSTTPNLERFARESIVFDHAYATAPWTLPSHASIFTGRYPHEQSGDWREPLDDTYPTLAEYLAGKGYETAAFFANPFYGSPRFGLDRGFLHYENEPLSLAAVLENAWLTRELGATLRKALGSQELPVRKDAARMNRDLLRWLDRHEGRPFFAFVNYFDAHHPYLAPEEYRTGDERPYQPEYWGLVPARYERDHVDALRREYEATLRYLDDHVARLLDELDRRGVLENTLVIITSDHGEEFGRHGVVGHGNSLYTPSLAVPLLVRLPGRSPSPAGVRVPGFVSLRDIPATVVELTRLADGAPFPGGSLAPLWSSSAPHGASPVLSEVTPAPRAFTAWYPVSHGVIRSLASGGLHYIHRQDGQEELYDLEADPWEESDLARRPEEGVRLARMRELFSAAHRRTPQLAGR